MSTLWTPVGERPIRREPPAAPGPAQDADGQLDQAAQQQRYGGEQTYIKVGNREVVPDERHSGTFGAVDKLIGELDRECGRQTRQGGPGSS